MENKGGAWKRKGKSGEFLSLKLDRGYNGTLNLLVFNGKKDDTYSVCTPVTGGMPQEVGKGILKRGQGEAHHIELTLQRGIDGDPVMVFLFPNKRKSLQNREPDYNVCKSDSGN